MKIKIGFSLTPTHYVLFISSMLFTHSVMILFFFFSSLSFFHPSQMPDVVRKTDFEKRELVFFRSTQQDNLELSIKLDLIWKKKKTQAPGTTSTETIAMMMVSSGDGLKAIARK